MNSNSRIPITRNGLDSLNLELEDLKKESIAVIEAISEARKHGDLSENAEYLAARERQSTVEGKIINLTNVLSRAIVVEPDESDLKDPIVKFGATVTVDAALEGSNNSSRKTYKVVGEYESDVANGLISVSSPIAAALIGKRVGEVVEVSIPKGYVMYKIINIEFK